MAKFYGFLKCVCSRKLVIKLILILCYLQGILNVYAYPNLFSLTSVVCILHQKDPANNAASYITVVSILTSPTVRKPLFAFSLLPPNQCMFAFMSIGDEENSFKGFVLPVLQTKNLYNIVYLWSSQCCLTKVSDISAALHSNSSGLHHSIYNNATCVGCFLLLLFFYRFKSPSSFLHALLLSQTSNVTIRTPLLIAVTCPLVMDVML